MEQTAFRLEDQSARLGIKLWTLTFDLPGEKVNKLDLRVMKEMEALIVDLEKLGSENKIDVLVLLSGKTGNFIAGADIKMFQAAKTVKDAEAISREGQQMADRWEDLPFPTVVAINGTALGGGCELSLASSAIVMSNDSAARIGLPEVNLGIIPGMGGCIRLPRKVGVATALDLILTGKTLNGDRAYRAGLAEACLPKENFVEAALQWTKINIVALKAKDRIAKEPKFGGVGGPAGLLLEKTPMGRSYIIKKAREGVLAKTKGKYPSAIEALDVIHETGGAYGEKIRGKAREKAMIREAEGFAKMALTDVSKNLVRLFFITEGVKRSKGIPAGSQATAKSVRSAAVLGAGTMGGGIAQLCAEKGVHARMKDINSQSLTVGIQSATKIFKDQVKKKRMSTREFQQKLNLIAPVLDFSGFHAVDVVIEAVVEKLEIKQKVFQELESYVNDSCILASNTSSLPISEMQSVLKNPSRLVGMHFFNPVHKMPLIEVIRGKQTSDEAVATIFQFSKQIGKTPIVVKDGPGFLVNRLLLPYMNEATFLVADGVPIPDLDQAILDFGMPMGPMALIDEVGIDVGEKVAHILEASYGKRMETSPLNGKVVGSGRLGKKNGKGFYIYTAEKNSKKTAKTFDASIYEILGIKPRPGAIKSEEMVDRCILPMINEASRCLEEGVVSSAAEVDIGMIMGTGFPPFRGGLLRYADSLGLPLIVEKLEKYAARFGARYEPAPALLTRVKNEQKFYKE